MALSHLSNDTTTLHRGVKQIILHAPVLIDPWFELEFEAIFVRPDGSRMVAEGFYDGDDQFCVRAYCDVLGVWRWTVRSNVEMLNGQHGEFKVVSSDLPGKLRIHPDDPHQFVYDNAEWFLHIGDTGYRYVVDAEPDWQAYIDQSVEMGATKIRVWFCSGRGDVKALFIKDRRALNLPYWQEMERRLLYALEAYPRVMIELIPYGEDTDEIRRYDVGDAASQLIARYAQARFSAFPNVYWCITNDRKIMRDETQSLEGPQVYARTIDRMGRDMAGREPWGTLLTNHQRRSTGYDFVDASWSDIVTLEDLDQVDGAILCEYRLRRAAPIINDEDRYETYRPPQHPRYFFRRLMWASLLSGGHATYCALRTFEPFEQGDLCGMRGYYDSVRAGKIAGGAHDFCYIHKFFADSGLTMVGMQPDDAMVGGKPGYCKCVHDANNVLVYLANPSGDASGTSAPVSDDEAKTVPFVDVQLGSGAWQVRWYDPTRGAWHEGDFLSGGSEHLIAPGGGDWVLWLLRQ